MVQWFDGAMADCQGHQEFHAPVDIEDLLGNIPQCIWPILMPCDLLPVVGNNAGDYLCLRIDSHNRIAEVVHWYHGGGDWIPWGKTLPEAIVFDLIVARLPGPSKGHAVTAEDPRPHGTRDPHSSDRLLDWAIEWVAPEVRSLARDAAKITDGFADEVTAKHWLEVLSKHRIAVEAIALQKIQSVILDPSAKIDWKKAQSVALGVLAQRQDLAWVSNVAGDAASYLGTVADAQRFYRESLGSSNFSDQSVRLGMRWDTKCCLKYAAMRLLDLQGHDGLDEMCKIYCVTQQDPPSSQSIHERVKRYWLAESVRYEQRGDLPRAIRCTMQAGWDVGLDSMAPYRPILERIVTLTESANQPARAEVARTHLACFDQRYG